MFIEKILPLVCLLLSAALLVHASYISVLGGSGFFFFFNIALIMFVNIYRHVDRHAGLYQWLLVLGIILLAWMSSVLLHALVALLVYLLLLWIAYRLETLRSMPCWVLLCLVVLLVNQQCYLNELQDSYRKYHSGETWQQYGAL